MPSLKNAAARAFQAAMHLNIENIGDLLAASPATRLLDVGCDDGERSLRFAERSRATELFGFEAVPERAELARARGVDVTVGDAANGLPYEDGYFDAVVSNQVIEHLHDTDGFVRECARVLRPGGIAVISTENLSSWHNVFAAICGWQPFSLTNVSGTTGGLGNPLALFRGQPHTQPSSWQHVRVFAYRGLKELFEEHALRVEKISGAGYFPLPATVGRRDPRHAVFLTVAARRLA
jgi:SAM-dependent methyltransferase